MTFRKTAGLLLAALLICAAYWAWTWTRPGPLSPSGGLYFPARVEIPLPHFAQADPRWGGLPLGSTPSTIAGEGCAVAAAAMVLAGYGAAIDPGKLNAFLTARPGGYTPEGWIYWEKAAEIDPALTAKLLPHYEDAGSYFWLDWNLFRGNPVIVRLRYGNGTTHFVVVVGKQGRDYLVLDPGHGFGKGVYPLREFGSDIEAIRFYRLPSTRG
ncbi:MAG TPA: cysteine peptidase family C39 domain-containing protein [Chthoniobacterales bacterium]